jgi:hypothetical protein
MEEFLPTVNFHELVKSVSPTLLSVQDDSLPQFMQEIQVMDGQQHCDSAVFLPIRSTAETVLGFIIIGINPSMFSSAQNLRCIWYNLLTLQRETF